MASHRSGRPKKTASSQEQDDPSRSADLGSRALRLAIATSGRKKSVSRMMRIAASSPTPSINKRDRGCAPEVGELERVGIASWLRDQYLPTGEPGATASSWGSAKTWTFAPKVRTTM